MMYSEGCSLCMRATLRARLSLRVISPEPEKWLTFCECKGSDVMAAMQGGYV